MKSNRSRRCYGTLTLSRQDLRRLRQEWAVVETPVHPMRLVFTVPQPAERRMPVNPAAA